MYRMNTGLAHLEEFLQRIEACQTEYRKSEMTCTALGEYLNLHRPLSDS